MINAKDASRVEVLAELLAIKRRLGDLTPQVCLDTDDRATVWRAVDQIDTLFNKLLNR